jgi:hypothetical protein
LDNENELIDNRINWLLASQALLFAAVTVGGKADGVSRIIALVGFFSSVAIFISTLAAISSSYECREHLRKRCKAEGDAKWCYELRKDRSIIGRGFFAPRILPLIFAGAWIAVYLHDHNLSELFLWLKSIEII